MTPRVLAGSGKYGEHVCADFKAWVAFLSAGDALDGGQDRHENHVGCNQDAVGWLELLIGEVGLRLVTLHAREHDALLRANLGEHLGGPDVK